MKKLVKHELTELLKNPAILAVIILPIIMSKVITATMKIAEVEFLLLSIWIVFAQVMVGIMLTGPNIIEEREGKTIDALLCTPLNFRQIVIAKGFTIFLFSVFSQLAVFLINRGLDIKLFSVLIPIIIGGILFIEIGVIIGFKVNSSKNGSAVASVIMIGLFLIVSVYALLPDWTYNLFILIPSIEITEVINHAMEGKGIFMIESLFSFLWVILLSAWILKIGKKY
jgi:ABC-2 type transport system permease protein